jgi:polysaccharide biosynthesis protein PslH
LWRRLGFRLRRRLAHILVRTVMFEEFAMVERQLAGLRELAIYTQTEIKNLNTGMTELVSLMEYQGQALRELTTRQVEPFRRPREFFVAGVKPLAGGEVPSLPEVSEQLSEDASIPSPANVSPSSEDDVSSKTPFAEVQRALRQPTGALKIAVFTPYLPYPPDTGGKIRSYHLLRALAARFDVDLFSVHHGAEPATETISALREYCCQVVCLGVEKPWRTRDRWRRVLAALPRSVDFFHTPDSLSLADRYLRTGQYDAVVADEICMNPYAELAPHLPRVMARQKVDHLHYVEMAKARPWGSDRVLDSLEALRLRRYEQAKMPYYQAFLACSEHDAEIIGRDAPNARALVIPNGVDLGTFASSNKPESDEQILLYVGSMNYYPNIDAMKFFFETMYDRLIQALPTLRVQIVGHSPPPEIRQLARRPGVEVVGGVPDMRPYLDAATVFMVPLRLGGGTRLKIVEAMARRLPVVSTSVGAEGLDIHPGRDILIADDAVPFAGEVLRLFADAELRAHLGEGGSRLAARYDWKELMRPFADLVEVTAGQRG